MNTKTAITAYVLLISSIVNAQKQEHQYLEFVKVDNTIYQFNYLSKENSLISQMKLVDVTHKTYDFNLSTGYFYLPKLLNRYGLEHYKKC